MCSALARASLDLFPTIASLKRRHLVNVNGKTHELHGCGRVRCSKYLENHEMSSQPNLECPLYGPQTAVLGGTTAGKPMRCHDHYSAFNVLTVVRSSAVVPPTISVGYQLSVSIQRNSIAALCGCDHAGYQMKISSICLCSPNQCFNQKGHLTWSHPHKCCVE